MKFNTLHSIDTEIERLKQLIEFLQSERIKMFEANKRKTIEEIKSEIDFYGITIEDLGLINTAENVSTSNQVTKAVPNTAPLEYNIHSVTMDGFLLQKPDGTTTEFTGYNLLSAKHICRSHTVEKFHCTTRLKNHKEIIIGVSPIFLEFFIRALNYKIVKNADDN